MFKKFYRLMSPEDGNGSGGAGGLGDGGTPNDTGTPNDGGTPAPKTPPNSGGDTYEGPAWAKDFELDDEIRKDPSLKVFNDIPSLIKSHVHAQKQLGKKGVMIPSENSPREEWDQFYQKIGVEIDPNKYMESAKIEESKVLGQEFGKEFLAKAHELRIAPKQAKEMFSFFENQTKTSSEKYINDSQTKVQESLNALRDELGADAYNAKLSKTAMYLEENVGKEFLQTLKESGLGKDARLLKAFFTLSDKYYKEDTLPAGQNGGAMSLSDIEKEINNVYANMDDAYNKPNHPDHKRRVNEINQLFAKKERLGKKS